MTQPRRAGADSTQRASRARAAFLSAVCVSVIALVAAGCGSHRAPSAAPTKSTPAPTPLAVVSPACVTAMKPTVSLLIQLDTKLDNGITKTDYQTAVLSILSAYNQIPTDTLDNTCLAQVGGRAEEAMNDYINAGNDWTSCLQTAGCTNEQLQPQLRGTWHKAGAIIAEIKQIVASN